MGAAIGTGRIAKQLTGRRAAVLGIFLLSACGGSEPTAPPTPTTLTLSAVSLSFDSLGASQQLTATVRDQSGAMMSGVTVAWTSSNTGVVTVSPSGLVTAVGNGAATVSATVGAAQSVIGVSVDDPDPDRDGLLAADDACPMAPETFNGWRDDDGCPDVTTELYDFARADVEGFWQAVFTASGLTYHPVQVFNAYDAPFESPCGTIPLNNAIYCVLNWGVFYHRAFMDGYLARVGDMAPAFIVSHEIGHHVTFLLGYFKAAWSQLFPALPHYLISDKQSELMADCFGGAWVANADQRGLLDEGDGEEAAKTLIEIGDTTIPWFSPAGHGTAQQRLLAFLIGAVDGPAGCVQPDFFTIFPVEGEIEQAAPPSNPLGSGHVGRE